MTTRTSKRKQRNKKNIRTGIAIASGATLIGGGVYYVSALNPTSTDDKQVSNITVDSNLKESFVKKIVSNKSNEDYLNADNEGEVLYKYINSSDALAYSMANPPQGYSSVPHVKFKLNDKVEVIKEKDNYSYVKVNGFKVWVASDLLSSVKTVIEVFTTDKESITTQKEEPSKNETTKVEIVKPIIEETITQPTVESIVTEKEEIIVGEKEETLDKESIEDNSNTEQQEDTSKGDNILEEDSVQEEDNNLEEETPKEDNTLEGDSQTGEDTSIEDPCTDEVEDKHFCIEELVPVEGGNDIITRTVEATTILGNKALVIEAGTRVAIGEDRPDGKISVLYQNKHGYEVQLVVDADAVSIYEDNMESDIEVESTDSREDIFDSLKDEDSITLLTSRGIEAKGYGINKDKSTFIPAFSFVDAHLNTNNGSDLAISYENNTWIISVDEAIHAGLI